jgi:hypothetical protein
MGLRSLDQMASHSEMQFIAPNKKDPSDERPSLLSISIIAGNPEILGHMEAMNQE